MSVCCKGDDAFKKYIVRKPEPLLRDVHTDGTSTIVTAFIPCFVKLGFVFAVIPLVEAIVACPFLHPLNIVPFEMRSRVGLG